MSERPPKAPPKRTQWNSTIPARTGPLPRRTRPVARTAVTRSSRKAKRFGKRRNDAFRAFVREQPCILASWPKHACEGRIECCHIRTRAAGADDVGECFAACSKVHRAQHLMGIKSFARFYRLDLEAEGRRLAAMWGWPDAET